MVQAIHPLTRAVIYDRSEFQRTAGEKQLLDLYMTVGFNETQASSSSEVRGGRRKTPPMGERPQHERIAELQAEIEMLRRENAALLSLKDALQGSEERYRRLFEDDLTGDFLASVDGRILACNPAFLRIFGFASIEDALQTNIRDLYADPEDRDRLLERLEREGKVENEGMARRRRDGSYIHVVENLVGRFDADGELVEIQGYTYDDSERKRAEDALQENMRWYQQILDNPFVGYVHCEIVTDTAGNPVDIVYLEVNRAFEFFTGIGRDAALHRRVTEFFTPEEVTDLITIYGRVALTGESATFEYPLPSLSRWFEVTAFSFERGRVTAFFTDITKRKRAEAVHRESEERFRAVLESSLDVVYRLNLQTDRYDYVSPVVGEILGVTPGEMTTMDHDAFMDRVHPEDRPVVEEEFYKSILRTKGFLVYRFRAKDGQYRWLEDHFTVIDDVNGWPHFRSGIFRDITERKQTEEALQRHAAELTRIHRDLESAHREANLYLDILTHDIRNTENVSNLYTELLLDSVEGEAVGYLVNLKRSITKSIEILGMVSKIRRIHAGPPLLRPTDLDAVIRAEIAHFPEVPIHYEGTTATVLADDLLSEIFTNLIGNAVKHGGPGVAISIRVEADEVGFFRVTVADTGRGVPDSQKDVIFHRYERKQRGVGEGLGLYLVQILVDRYGGRIWVEDRVPGRSEQGAAFSFLLREAEGVPVRP